MQRNLKPDVALIGNTPPDFTHCFQCTLGMALMHFTGVQYSIAELDTISQKEPRKWTWPLASIVWLLHNGFGVQVISTFNYERFADEGGAYLLEVYGEEAGRAQIQNSRVELERQRARVLAAQTPLQMRTPNMQDVSDLLAQGYLVICQLNAKKLNNRNGYAGHFVLVTARLFLTILAGDLRGHKKIVTKP